MAKMKTAAKQRLPKRKKAARCGREATGLLAGQVEELMPPALEEDDHIGDTSVATAALVSETVGSDDEGPPEEMVNQAAPEGFAVGLQEAAAAEEARAQQEPPVSRKRQRKAAAAAAAGAETTAAEGAKDGAHRSDGSSAEFFWQKEESKTVLDALRQQEEQRRKRHQAGRVEKNGVELVSLDHALTAKEAHGHASVFLQQELFERRKRTRNPGDTWDRNRKGHRLGVHRKA